MRFQRGTHYPHPPRGPGRKPYAMSDAALRQRCRNLRRTRIRSDRETAIIKRLIWQPCCDSGPRSSQRALARQLGVRPSYVHKLLRKAQTEGMDVLLLHGRVTFADLQKARQFTVKLREQEPGLLAPQPRLSDEQPFTTATEIECEAQKLIRQAHRQNPGLQPMTWQEHEEGRRGSGRRVLLRIPVPR
jgi:hypothetical protein